MPDAPVREQRIASDGDAGRTGDAETERAVSWALAERARARLRVQSAPLELIMNNDFDDELAALRAGKKKYGEFKPVLLHFGEAVEKIFQGIGWVDLKPEDPLKQADPTRTKVFDLGQADPGKALEGVADLVELIYEKSTIRFTLPDKLKDWLKEKLDIRPPMDLTPELRERAKKEQEARMNAAVELLVTLLKLWAHWKALSKGKEEGDGDPVAALVEDFAVIVKCLIILCRDRIGRANLKRWSATLRARQDLAQDRSDELSLRLDAMRGLSPEKMAENDRKRREAADEARKERNEAADSEVVASEVGKVLSGIAGIIEKAGEFSEAMHAVWPEDLAGDWVLDGAPDLDRAWLLKLAKAENGVYFGTLSVRGYPPGTVNAVRSNPPVTEPRAQVFLLPQAEPTRYVLQCIPAGNGTWKLATQADARFRAGVPLLEPLEMKSTRSLEGKASGLAQAPGKTGDVRLVRASEAGHVVELVVAAVKLVAAVPEALPSSWQAKIEEWVRGKLSPWFNAAKDRFLPKALEKYGEISCEAGRLKLGLKRAGTTGTSAGFGVSAVWDLMALVEWACAAEAERASKPSPWVPVSLGGSFRFPKWPFDVAIELSPFDPAKEKEAGKQGIEDKLDGFEWKDDLDRWARSLGARYDILEPSLEAGAAADGGLPKLKIPIVFYLEEWKAKSGETYRWYVKVKLTIGVGADVFATIFPQVRAALFAWQAGWAVGTFLREGVLMKSETYRDMEASFQSWAAGVDPGLDRVTGAIASGTAELFNACMINGWERDLAHAKAELYAWTRVLKNEGYPKRFEAASWNRIQGAIADRVEYLRTGAIPEGSRVIDPNPPQSPFYMHAYAQALVYQHCWGFAGARPADEIEALLAEAEALGQITPARQALLRAMLRPEGYAERVAEIRRAAASPKRPEMALEEKHILAIVDAPVYRDPALAQTYSGFRLLVDVINEPWPSGAFQDDLEIVRAPSGQVRWRVTRAKANERLSIRFFETSGIDDVLPRTGGGETFEAWADRHAYEGDFASLAGSLREYRGRDGKIEVYAKVFDARSARELGTTRAWTLMVSGAGAVTDFVRQ